MQSGGKSQLYIALEFTGALLMVLAFLWALLEVGILMVDAFG